MIRPLVTTNIVLRSGNAIINPIQGVDHMITALEFTQECIDWIELWSLDCRAYGGLNHAPGKRWLVRSGLQKACRRGQTEAAMRLALALQRIDPDYVWRALATIAVEDIGFGCPEAVTYASFGTLKNFREEVGADQLLAAVVVSMCAADKSRSACELSTAGDLANRPLIERMANLESPALWPHIKSRDMLTSYAALRAIRGYLPRGMPGLPRSMEDRDDAGVWLAEHLPRQHAMAAVASFDRPTDSMSIAYGPTTIFAQTEDLHLTADDIPESDEIGGFAAEAWDVHCREGKLALKAFHTSLAKVYPEMVTEIMPAKVTQALGALVFVVEGCLVDRRLTSPELSVLQHACDVALMEDAGVPREVPAESGRDRAKRSRQTERSESEPGRASF